MSPRAAWRLEGMGFSRVYDYVPGKADWSASGLPTEGTRAGTPTIGEAARRDVPTCAPAEKVGAVRERLGGSSLLHPREGPLRHPPAGRRLEVWWRQ